MDKIINCKWMSTDLTPKSRKYHHRAATCMPAVRDKFRLGIEKTQHTINYGLLKQKNITEGKQRCCRMKIMKMLITLSSLTILKYCKFINVLENTSSEIIHKKASPSTFRGQPDQCSSGFKTQTYLGSLLADW